MKDLYTQIAAGKPVFREGDAGAEMYIVETGSVEIVRAARGNEPVALLEAGDFFGEMAILEDLPRYASAVAKTDCRLLRIERATFADLLGQNVEIAVRIMRKLAARQRQAELHCAQLQEELDQLRQGKGAAVVADVPAKAAKPAKPDGAAKAELSAAKAVPPARAAAPAPPAAPVVAAAPPPPAVVPAAKPEAPPAPAAKIEPSATPCVLLHPASGQKFTLQATSGEMLVGRTDPVTGITPEVNLGALDTTRSLSRRHAKLLVEGGMYFLREEVGTANGTYVNGQKLATGATAPLKPGDKLRFGSIEMELAPA